MSIASLLSELDARRCEALHEAGDGAIVPCSCGELALPGHDWRAGPQITHRDFSVRIHDVRYCGPLEDAESELRAAKGE